MIRTCPYRPVEMWYAWRVFYVWWNLPLAYLKGYQEEAESTIQRPSGPAATLRALRGESFRQVVFSYL